MIGELKFFLGLQVHQSVLGIFISQSQYAIEILKKCGIDECVSMSTPMATERLDANLQCTPIDQMTYRRMIGGLMYLTANRPDIAFATFVCARYQACPIVKHLKEVKRIFQYLEGGSREACDLCSVFKGYRPACSETRNVKTIATNTSIIRRALQFVGVKKARVDRIWVVEADCFGFGFECCVVRDWWTDWYEEDFGLDRMVVVESFCEVKRRKALFKELIRGGGDVGVMDLYGIELHSKRQANVALDRLDVRGVDATWKHLSREKHWEKLTACVCASSSVPIPIATEAEDIILQEIIQLSIVDQKSRDDLEAKQDEEKVKKHLMAEEIEKLDYKSCKAHLDPVDKDLQVVSEPPKGLYTRLNKDQN
ncbi:hypothetical protein Tco_0103352 [Tanacetum coccineum]